MPSASQANSRAIEEMPHEVRRGALLEVNEVRLDPMQILELYRKLRLSAPPEAGLVIRGPFIERLAPSGFSHAPFARGISRSGAMVL
jgi:hypothetical protein